jgi:hypothetical protein
VHVTKCRKSGVSAFTTDQGNSKYWFSTLNKIFKILKLDIKNLADNRVFRNNLIEYYHQQSDSQLQKIKSGAVDSKLILFSNIFIPNFVLLSLLQYRIYRIVLLLEF